MLERVATARNVALTSHGAGHLGYSQQQHYPLHMPLFVHHSGYIGAERVPGILRCSSCGFACLVREGNHLVRLPGVDATDSRPKPPRPGRKRVLMPRVTAA